METTQLRALVKAACAYWAGAKVWPNGLGFTAPGAWDFGYSESRSVWIVSKRRRGILVRGEGKTAQEAYFNARPVKEES